MKTTLLIAAAIMLAACGRSGTGFAEIATLPATIEGTLTIDHSTGNVDPKGYSHSNFGTLIAGNAKYMVEVEGEALRTAGVHPQNGDRVVATIGAKGEMIRGLQIYKITQVRKP